MSRENNISVETSPAVAGELGDDEIRMQINLRLRLDEVAEEEAQHLRATARRLPTSKELCRLACNIYDCRRARDRIIDRKLFGEPAWDMLLALYCLPKRGEIMTVTSLSIAACVPAATGNRWQRTLTEEGLIERGPPGADARKQFLRLTATGRAVMDRYLTHLFYCEAPVPDHSSGAAG